MVQPAPEDRPVFVLGTGRCGSTYIQSVLCGTADLWIWGEHDGILAPLFAWGRQVRSSPNLVRASYPHAAADPVDRLHGRTGAAPWMAAWINGFTPETLDEVERGVLRGLFARGLPAGKRRWGFKEIRYGAGDDTIERLLALFPAARVVHVVRHPCAMAESALRTWTWTAVLQDAEAGGRDAVARRYAQHVAHWGRLTAHLLELEARQPDAVRTIRIEDAETALPALAQFLGAPPEEMARAAAATATRNTGPRRHTGADASARSLLQDLRGPAFAQVKDLAARLGYGVELPMAVGAAP